MFLFWRIILLQKVVLLAKVKIPAIKLQNAIDPSDNSPLKMQHGLALVIYKAELNGL
jgi:hypothetical protein